MKKTEVIKTYAKGLKVAKLKSYILAMAGGIIAGLMYKVGVQAGVNATCQNLAEAMPEDTYDGKSNDENDTN